MARKNRIIITEQDRGRLEDLFVSSFVEVFSDKPYLIDLQRELDAALIVASDSIPGDVITMNSTVRLKDMKNRQVETFTLVYPDVANIAEDKLSILAPLGTAILGYRAGDTICWRMPCGESRWRVEEIVFQPERENVVV